MQDKLEYEALLHTLKRHAQARPAPTFEAYRRLVEGRTASERGVLTQLKADPALALLPPTLTGDVAQMGARLNGNLHEIGIVVMCSRGSIVWIEGFTCDPTEFWPAETEGFELIQLHA